MRNPDYGQATPTSRTTPQAATDARHGRGSYVPYQCPEGCGPVVPGDGEYACARGHSWLVRNAIPRFVPEAASYADAFGLQWNTFRRTQLDSYSGIPLSRDRVRRCIGEEGWAAMHDPAARVQLLEVGCGAGRFTEVLVSAPGAAVTSVDLSSAVDANQDNVPQSDRHRIAQADALKLPFAPRQYHVVLCLGVIQHTPDPERTIAALYEQVRPGGLLVIDHYPAVGATAHLRAATVFRALFTRLSPQAGLRWTRRVVRAFLPLHEGVRGNRVARSLLARVSPLTQYYGVLPLSDPQQREWALLDTHDALTDRYKHRRSRDQIRATLAQLGLTDVWCEEGGNGVEARGRRPA